MRRSARVAAAVDARTSALPELPVSLAARVLRFLPVDDRGRAACVCRGWRAALADPALWMRLDLSQFEKERITDAFLRGAAAKAQGQLEQLAVPGVPCTVTQAAVLEMVVANAGSLRELRLNVQYAPGSFSGDLETLRALAQAAPLLRTFEFGSYCAWLDASQLMRAELPPSLQLRELTLMDGSPHDYDLIGLDLGGSIATALANTALHATMSRLCIANADIKVPALLDAFVDGLLPRQLLRVLEFRACSPPAPAPLARLLLRGNALAHLTVSYTITGGLIDAGGAMLVADALRANTTLQVLTFHAARLCDDVPAACVVLRALVGHPSLRQLELQDETPDDSAAVGAALAALLTADTPALHTLHLRGLQLLSRGLTPLMDALPHNHHLRSLDISRTDASQAFGRDRMLPAVRANTSLRALHCGDDRRALFPAEAEAQQLVRSRPPLR